MLGKLIKYEFRATGRIMLPLAAAIILLSVVAGFSQRLLDMSGAPDFVNFMAVMFLALFVFGLFGICVVAVVQMVERFYRNLLCDEGYLMFTLPTTPDALVCSKIIVSSVWFTATGILCCISLAVMLFVSSAVIDWSFTGDLPEMLRKALEILGNGSTAAGAGHIAGWIAELLVLWFMQTVALCLRFYAAMAIGFSFDEHKKLLSVVFFFLIGIAMNTIGAAVFTPLVNSGLFEKIIFPEVFSPGRLHAILLGCAAIGLIENGIYYLVTTLMLRKRLNLA